MKTSRRDFIKKSTLATTGVGLGLGALSIKGENATKTGESDTSADSYAGKSGTSGANTGKPVTDGAQQERREQLYNLLCDLPPRDLTICAKTVNVEKKNGYVLEKLLLDLNGQQPVPAWFAKPENAKTPLPSIIFCHSHGGKYKLGKDELIQGNTYMPGIPYAEALTQMGYNVLCIDHWIFGERSGRGELEFFKETLWRGQCLWGMMVYDSLRAMDYLCQRPEVDTSKIGAMGMSMGSTMAVWLSALDTRVKACADICCLTDYDALIEDKGLDRHGIYYYVPSLLKYFSAASVNALIAPRAHLSVAGRFDKLTPLPGLHKIDAALKKEYEAQNAGNKWKLTIYDTEHFETPEMRKELLSFLKRELG